MVLSELGISSFRRAVLALVGNPFIPRVDGLKTGLGFTMTNLW